MDTRLSYCRSALEVHGAEIPQGRVPSGRIVEAFDVIEHLGLGVIAGAGAVVPTLVKVLSVLCEPVSPRWRSVFGVFRSGGDLTPVGKRRCAALLKRFPVDEMAFQIEVAVDAGMDRGELL